MGKEFIILTSAYNSGRYMLEWADSIIRQDYRPINVVLINDRSTDNTLEVVSKIKDRFKENYIGFCFKDSEKKLYCGSGYNLALKIALKVYNGSYFGVLDSDDMLKTFACKYIAKVYDKNKEVKWIYTQYDKYNRKMNRILKRGFCHAPPPGETILSLEARHYNIYSHWRTFSNRLPTYKKLFKKHLRGCVDKNLGLRLEELGIGMFVDKVCYKFRTRSKGEKSISHFQPLIKLRKEVINDARRRRKKMNKIYPIWEYR